MKILSPFSDTRNVIKYYERQMVVNFLGDLSPEYYAAKLNILTGDEIPDLSKAFYHLNKLSMNASQSSIDSNNSVLAVSGGRGRGNFTPNRRQRIPL